MTSYVVLRKVQLGDSKPEWREASIPVESVSAEAAIRKAATEKGVYVAIPVRSFKPVSVSVETPAPVIRLDEIPATP